MFFIPQIQKDDCGMAALKMLLAEVHQDRNYLFVPQDENHGPYSYGDLIEIARIYHVELEGFSADNKKDIKGEKSFPMIVTLVFKGAMHAVVVYKIKGHTVYYLDPIEGKKALSLRKFIDLWDGTLLKVMQFVKAPCPYKEEKPIRQKQWLILNVLQAFAAVLAIAGVFSITKNIHIFLPISLFSFAIILEIIAKAYSFSIMKSVDNFFYEQVEVPNKQYAITLKRFERYKHGLLTSPSNFVLSFLITLALIVIVLNNDIKNFLLIAAPLIAASIEALFYRPYLRNGIRDVGRLEEDLDNSQDEEDYKGRVGSLHKTAYKIGKVEMFKRYIGLALFLAIAIVLVAINGKISFPYVIFYLCIQIAIYHCLKSLLDYPLKWEEMLKEKVEINNCLHQNDENK
ncbi:MAG: hypothetical protein K6F07_01545 [Bacilli bacterium]|nr:hypothetical protein [Bacilli bacterium]